MKDEYHFINNKCLCLSLMKRLTDVFPSLPPLQPAHVKACFIGSSLTLPISEGKLNLGTWQVSVVVFLGSFTTNGLLFMSQIVEYQFTV